MLKKSVARVLDRSSTWILKSPQSTILSWFKTRLDTNSESSDRNGPAGLGGGLDCCKNNRVRFIDCYKAAATAKNPRLAITVKVSGTQFNKLAD